MEAFKKNVPALRFTGFEGDWVQASFGSFVKRTSNKYDPNSDSEVYPCIELEHLSSETGILLGTVRSKDQKSIKNYFNEGEVLYGKLRPYLKKFYFAKFDGVCSSEIWVLKGVGVSNVFLYYLIQTSKFNDGVNVTSGSKMPRAEWDVISSSLYNYPSILEQTKIASFLTAVDDKIHQITRKKDLLEQYKKGVMQKIFSREIRFRDEQGKEYPEWEEKRLGEVFSRITTKNRENNQNVLTISAQQGLINQEEYFNKSVAAKNLTGYYLLEKGDFAYNKSYSNGYPLGAIKRLANYDKGIVSTLYICFRIKDESDPAFFEHYFESSEIDHELEKIAQEGARNHGLLNMSVVDFFDLIMINVPVRKEQGMIAYFITAIDQKISLVSSQLNKMQTWKKGLLQKMFV